MKKLLAVILCISLLLLSFPINANAVGTTYDINVSAGDGGRIARSEDGPSENGDISVEEGNNITLYIIPESHYAIDDVMVDGFSEGAISQYTFNNVTLAHSISATFTRNTKTITVASVSNGEILINGMGESGSTVTVNEGCDATITVRPGAGYEIDSVTIGAITYSLDGEIGDRTGEFSRTVTVDDNISVSAVFRTARHTITTNVGPNGTLSPMNPMVNHGSDQTFTITPNPGYRIRSVTVDGNPASVDEHNQITLFNVQNDRMMSVDFAEVVNYTITTISGPNGSISPGSPTVAQGADVTFTITPNPGYIIDELRVDGLPEMADEHNQFTVFNVQRSMTLEVSFMEAVAHTITIPKPVNGNIQIVGESSVVPAGGSVITRNTREMVSYFITPDIAYRISEINLKTANGESMEFYDFYYDETAKKIRIDIETEFNYTLEIKFIQIRASTKNYFAILKSETDTNDHIKDAVRRELGLLGHDIPVEYITLVNIGSYVSLNGVDYDRIVLMINDPVHGAYSLTFYTVEEYTNLVVWVAAKRETIIIIEDIEAFPENAQLEIPNMDCMYFFGPYGACVEGILSEDVKSAFRQINKNFLWIDKAFYRVQFHVTNRGDHVGKGLNWFPLTLITDDALCINVEATSENGTQDTFTWELNTYPHLTVGDSTQEVFFGNDRVILEKPRDNIGDIASMRATASNSPGYTFRNNSDGTITIDFMSDYYDKVTVPLTIVKQSGGTVQRNLIIHRVGVDIQAHNAADGNPSSTRTVFHGTQYGNLVNFADGNKYKITASYFIPDYGNNRPYGLYVTRKYANGKTETQIITQPIASPHPASSDLFDSEKKIFMYNDGSSGWANVADYLIYSGPNVASAPVEISVLVLKNAPASGNAFGGVDYGSGTGVKWTKP